EYWGIVEMPPRRPGVWGVPAASAEFPEIVEYFAMTFDAPTPPAAVFPVGACTVLPEITLFVNVMVPNTNAPPPAPPTVLSAPTCASALQLEIVLDSRSTSPLPRI